MILVNSYLEALVTQNSVKGSLDTRVEGLRFLILISDPHARPPPPLAFGLRSEHIADIFQSSALLSLQSQCHCSSHVVESSFDRALWWITWLGLLEKKSSDPIALFFIESGKKQHSIHFSRSFMSPAALISPLRRTQCFKSYSLQTLFFSSRWALQSKYLVGLAHKGSAFTCLRCWRQGTHCYVGGLEKQNFAGYISAAQLSGRGF